MKKLILFCSIATVLLISCSAPTETELTEEQKAAIVAEVESQYDGLVSTINEIDIDAWTEYWSEENFISVNSLITYFPSYTEWIDNVTYYFSTRESQDVQIVGVNTTVFSSDLVLLTSITNWNLIDTSGVQINDSKTLASLLWKKGTSGWKAIYLHESWVPDENEQAP